MIVSEVGRTTSGSSRALPPACVTTAVSGANPSRCSFSRSMNDCGMKRGKYAFWTPVARKRSSSSRCMSSQIR
jgi:hypothetical protein